MRFVIAYILTMLFLTLCLFSCTPAKRLSRIVKNNPHLIQTVDTTIYFETSSVDTSFVFNNTSTSDTFYIKETKTRVYRHFDTIRLEQETIRDSVFITTEKIEVYKNPKFNEISDNIFKKIVVILIFIVIIMVLYMFRNILKEIK